MKTKIIIGLLAIFSFLICYSSVQAATLFLTSSSTEIGMTEKIVVDLKIDSEGASFNAAQTTIRFPKNLVEAISLDKTDSAFSFWLEEPIFSNNDGIISFTGGTPYGVSGNSIQILKVIFTPKGSGTGNLSLSDAAITVSDGSGANILSKTIDLAFSIVPVKVVPTPKVLLPAEIIREPIVVSNLPVKPNLKVALYPNETLWYNLSGQFAANWDLPLDVSGVSALINKQPNFTPAGESEGLFDNKTFLALGDGVWYLHLCFKNNVGWGPVAHYRLAIDTQPPLGFEPVIIEGETTDNPTPTIQFKTSDALSGLREYQIRIDDGDLIKITAAEFKGSFKLPLQSPGKKWIAIKAIDRAGNGLENKLMLEITPIASPVINFVSKELFSDEEKGLAIKGTALPRGNVILAVFQKGALVANATTSVDEKGNWEFTFDQPFKNGKYILTAQSQDERGALSLPVESSEVLIKSKPIIQIGKFQLGKSGALIFLLLVIVGGFIGGIWFYKKRQEKLALRLMLVKTDMAKVFKLIQDDIGKLEQAVKTPTSADDEFMIKRLQENIEKMQGYLKKEVEKIK